MENSRISLNHVSVFRTSQALEITGRVDTTNMGQSTKMKSRRTLDKQWKSATLFKDSFSCIRWVEVLVVVLALTFCKTWLTCTQEYLDSLPVSSHLQMTMW